MAKLKKNYYFQAFLELVKYPLMESQLLKEIVLKYDEINIKEKLKEMHAIEHEADMANHNVILKLIKEFITPIEREDIIAICQKIDNVTDAIEDVLLRLYMYNVKVLRDDIVEFVEIIIKSCEALERALEELPNFKRSTILKDYIVEINHYEEEADNLYTAAVRKLFVGTKDPVELIVWEEIYLRLENCFDACEEAADIIEAVVMKNI